MGSLRSWNLSAEFRPHDLISLRSSLSAANSPPSMRHLYSTESQDHPYIECDPGPGDPPRSCPSPNPRQVTREITGNPGLRPSDTKRVAIGFEARVSQNAFFAERYRLSRFDLVGVNRADWAMRNLEECNGAERSNCIERTGGYITIHDSYANIVETEINGVTTRFRSRNFETGLGELRVSGAWRHVIDAERRIAGNDDRYALAKNMARLRFQLSRGSREHRMDHELPRWLRKPVRYRKIRVLDRARLGAGLEGALGNQGHAGCGSAYSTSPMPVSRSIPPIPVSWTVPRQQVGGAPSFSRSTCGSEGPGSARPFQGLSNRLGSGKRHDMNTWRSARPWGRASLKAGPPVLPVESAGVYSMGNA